MSPVERELLAFCGDDLNRARGGQEIADLGRRYDLLALDGPAVAMATEAGIAPSLIDDWLSPQVLEQAFQQGLHLEETWFESARGALTSAGVCWPDADRTALHWFWQGLTHAEALVRAVAARGRSLTFLVPRRDHPSIHFLSSSVHVNVWQALGLRGSSPPLALAERVREGGLDRQRLSQFHSPLRLRARLRHWAHRLRGPLPATAARVVLAFNAFEASRILEPIEDLKRELGSGRLQGVVLAFERGQAERVAERWRIPVSALPPGRPGPLSLRRSLQAGLRSAFSAHPARLQRILSGVSLQWQRVVERWVDLDAQVRSWERLFGAGRPAVVLTSSLGDAESQLPARVARRLGIPTLALPHGAITVVHPELVASERLLFGNELQRQQFDAYGFPEERLRAARSLNDPETYALTQGAFAAKRIRARVLVLTGPAWYPGTLDMLTPPRSQLVALRAVLTPPPHLAGRLEVLVKAHPRFPDVELLEEAARGTRGRRVPKGVGFESLLPDTDVVVCVNYGGGGWLPPLRAGVPVVFLWIGGDARQEVLVCPRAGPLVRSADELWVAVDRLLADPDRARGDALSRAALLLEPLEETPTLGQLVRQLLDEGLRRPGSVSKPSRPR